MDPLRRNNVVFSGQGQQAMLFAHGFGCDQQMWRFTAPAFEADHRVVLFDHIGCGRSDLSAFDPVRHGSLQGYAEDVVDIIEAAGLHDLIFVGHSVSAMIGLLAALRAPGRFARLVMVCPSPRYLNDPPDYLGGFEREDIEGLIEMIESNMLGWASFLAPVVMGAGHPTPYTDELRASFCAIDASITRRFAEATFLADNRADLRKVDVRTLVIQMSEDAIAPPHIGRYVAQQMPHAELASIDGAGHCPHMTHPEATIAAIRGFLTGAPTPA